VVELAGIETNFQFRKVQVSALDILFSLWAVICRIFKVAEHLFQEYFFATGRVVYL